VFGTRKRKLEERKLRKSENKFGLKLVKVHSSISIIFFSPKCFFHQNKHTIKNQCHYNLLYILIYLIYVAFGTQGLSCSSNFGFYFLRYNQTQSINVPLFASYLKFQKPKNKIKKIKTNPDPNFMQENRER
jgi:hypothetical protein